MDFDLDKVLITDHAVERFCERIRQTERGREEIRHCLQAADPKLLRKVRSRGRARKTTYVMTGCCVLILWRGKVKTVITYQQLREHRVEQR